MEILIFLFRALRWMTGLLKRAYSRICTYILFKLNRVRFSGFRTNGIPFIRIHKNAVCTIGGNFRMNNTHSSNPIGRVGKCSFFVGENARLCIGENVGISNTSVVCHKEITIEDNVIIGGNTCIYDTDFHSLDPDDRKQRDSDQSNRQTASVRLKRNCFVGAHCTLLKGITIGENSIVGACSVVTRDIPDNQIWAGHPAVFIRELIK